MTMILQRDTMKHRRKEQGSDEMQNQRILDIVGILLKQEDFITIQQIATILQVSNKTIRNDLQVVGEWVRENQMTLCKKTGIGIRIEGDVNQKLKLLEHVLVRSKRLTDYTPQARKTYIGLRLLNCMEHCRIYELSEELFVSRATIHKDLTALQELLEQYHISLVRKSNQGVWLSGKEHNLRALMFALMTADKGYEDLEKMVRTRSCEQPSRFLFAALDYTEQDFFKILEVVLQVQSSYWNNLPFRALIDGFLQICILCLRVMDQKLAELSSDFIQELMQKPLYEEACEICDLLQEQLRITLPEIERRYLQVYLLALQNQEQLAHPHEAMQMTQDLLTVWQEIFQRPFCCDEELKRALQTHLGPAITRSRHGIRMENPMMYEIHTYYENTFQIVQHSLKGLEEKYGCVFNEDEVGYLTIHLAAALDRAKQPLRTILICHQGMGAKNLMIRKLEKYIPEIEIVSTQPFLAMEKTDLSGIDLILSTLPLELAAEIPVVTMHALPHDHDIQRVKYVVEQYYKQKNDPRNHINTRLLTC